MKAIGKHFRNENFPIYGSLFLANWKFKGTLISILIFVSIKYCDFALNIAIFYKLYINVFSVSFSRQIKTTSLLADLHLESVQRESGAGWYSKMEWGGTQMRRAVVPIANTLT